MSISPHVHLTACPSQVTRPGSTRQCTGLLGITAALLHYTLAPAAVKIATAINTDNAARAILTTTTSLTAITATTQIHIPKECALPCALCVVAAAVAVATTCRMTTTVTDCPVHEAVQQLVKSTACGMRHMWRVRARVQEVHKANA